MERNSLSAVELARNSLAGSRNTYPGNFASGRGEAKGKSEREREEGE